MGDEDDNVGAGGDFETVSAIGFEFDFGNQGFAIFGEDLQAACGIHFRRECRSGGIKLDGAGAERADSNLPREDCRRGCRGCWEDARCGAGGEEKEDGKGKEEKRG